MNSSEKPSGLPSRKELQQQRREAELSTQIPVDRSVKEPATQRVSLFKQLQDPSVADAAEGQPVSSQNPQPIAESERTPSGKETMPKQKKPLKKSGKAKRSFGKRLLRGFAFTALVGIILGISGFIAAYLLIKVPAPGEFALAQNTTVYYADGESEMGSFGELNRKIIDPQTLPPYVGKAVVASEDRSFYTNSGIDLWGIARAAVNNLRGGPLQGGSTLSQQYVERYYLDTTTGIVGKMKEAVLALKINRQQSKEEILGNYLNTIYFGRGAYGIEAAAQAYYGHSAETLSIAEAAMLAGIIPAPSAWDPAVSPEIAEKRFHRVLNLMVEDGWISADEKAAATFPETIETRVPTSFTGSNGYLMEQIRTELINKAGFTAEEINSGGYKIISTIDKTAQINALNAVAQIPPGHAENLRVALSAIDPRTGEIIAEYAGKDYAKLQSNSVTQDYAMAGSTMKPLGLMGYIAAGGTINDVYNANSGIQIKDSRTGVLGPVTRNYDDISYGNITLRFSTAKSANTSFLFMNDALGPEKTVAAAKRLGLREDTIGLEPNMNNILGSAAVHNIDLGRAYATFASGGVRIDPHIVRQVADDAGDVIYTAANKGERVYSTDEVSEILPALKDVILNGSGYKASYLGRPVAGKTGTSEDNKSAQFVAFIPQMVTTVSFYQVGPNGEQETITPWNGLRDVTGSSIPGEVWMNFMTPTVQNLPVEDFTWFKQQYRQTKFKKAAWVPAPPKEEKKDEAEKTKPAPADGDDKGKETEQPSDSGTTPTPGESGNGSSLDQGIQDGTVPLPEDPTKNNE